MSSLRSARNLLVSYAIVALVAPISVVDWTNAQRSGIKGGLQQNSYESQISQQQSGSNPDSVYGGYESQSSRFQQSTALSAPVNNRRTSSYVKQQTVNTIRAPVAPVVSQQSQSSSSYNEQISEADAEPASYGEYTIIVIIISPSLL